MQQRVLGEYSTHASLCVALCLQYGKRRSGDRHKGVQERFVYRATYLRVAADTGEFS